MRRLFLFFLVLNFWGLRETSVLFSDELRGNFYWYTIKRGNTPGDIARIFNVSISELRKNNPSAFRHWLYGKTLRIPFKGQGKIYKIQKGDSLYSITQKFQIPLSYLQKTLERQVQKSMWIGTYIFVPLGPSGAKNSLPSEKTKNFSPPSSSPRSYTVQKGDTYYGIAKKQGLDLEDLESLNFHKPLLFGTHILLPSPSSQKKTTPTPVNSEETKDTPFFGKLSPPYKGKSHAFSSLAPGIIYIVSKPYGENILSPLNAKILSVEPFPGFGTGIFLSRGNTTIVLASKGFFHLPVRKGKFVQTASLLAKCKYGYALYVFRIQNGSLRNPF